MTKTLYDALIAAPPVDLTTQRQIIEAGQAAAKHFTNLSSNPGFAGTVIAAYGNETLRRVLSGQQLEVLLQIMTRLNATLPIIMSPPRGMLKIINECKRRGIM